MVTSTVLSRKENGANDGLRRLVQTLPLLRDLPQQIVPRPRQVRHHHHVWRPTGYFRSRVDLSQCRTLDPGCSVRRQTS